MNIKICTGHVLNTGNSLQSKKKYIYIEKYYVSSKCNNPVLKLCIISFGIIKLYENTGPNNRG